MPHTRGTQCMWYRPARPREIIILLECICARMCAKHTIAGERSKKRRRRLRRRCECRVQYWPWVVADTIGALTNVAQQFWPCTTVLCGTTRHLGAGHLKHKNKDRYAESSAAGDGLGPRNEYWKRASLQHRPLTISQKSPKLYLRPGNGPSEKSILSSP